MAKNYFISRNSKDLDDVYSAIILWFKGKQYEVEGKENRGVYLIQARKTGFIRTLSGTNLAFRIKVYYSDDQFINNQEFVVETSRGKWIQNIAGAGFASLFTGGLTVFTGLAGMGWSFLLENDLISYLENELNLQRVKPDIPSSSIPITAPFNNHTYPKINLNKNSEQQKIIADLETEIDKLETAFSDEILTEEEFTTKKAILEKKIDDYEVNFMVEAKINKLQEAFSQGVLDDLEYEQKLQEIETDFREEAWQQLRRERNKAKIIKLKEALDSGIITQEEYQQKIVSLS
jgi:hypothetical protein